MRAYKEYKDSGYDWMGKIPAHWTKTKLRDFTKESNERRGSRQELELLSVYRDFGVIVKNSRDDNYNNESEDTSTYKYVGKDYLVINKMKLWQGSLGISEFEGIVSPAYITCKITKKINTRYLNYLLRSALFKTFYNRISYGIRVGQWDSDYDDIRQLNVFLPPREEQDAIVRFLDAKCAKIDSFIKLKGRQIALLNEKKQNIINQAVTRGLDPNAPMKDSGVDWIGEIPEGWEVLRCKYLFTETNVRSEKGEETHLSMSQKYGLVPDSMMEEKRMLSESYAGGKLCCKDDIVLNRLKAHLGVFALASQDGVVSPDYTVLSINKNRIFSHYAECILKSYSCRRELVIRVRGIVNGFLRLYTEDFNTIKLPLPTIDEQKRIMEFVSKIERIIKTKIDILENNILLMNEYRQRLISDVVTGKINILEGNSDV